jgi:hypothetical protein
MNGPPGSDRKSPRLELFAQAEARGLEVSIMPVRNLSAGGVYLEGTPQEYPEFVPGAELDLMIFGLEDGIGDDPEFNIECRARVIRIDPGWGDKRPAGFGCTIDPANQENRDRLSKLLLRASGRQGGR